MGGGGKEDTRVWGPQCLSLQHFLRPENPGDTFPRLSSPCCAFQWPDRCLRGSPGPSAPLTRTGASGTALLRLPGLFSLLQQGDHFWFGTWESCSQTKRKRKCLGFVLTQRAIPEWKMHGGYKKLQWVAQVVPPHERCVRKKKGLIGHTYVILSCMLGKYKHTALTGLSIEDGTYQMYRLN